MKPYKKALKRALWGIFIGLTYLAVARAGGGVFFSMSIAALQGNPIVTSAGLELTLPTARPLHRVARVLLAPSVG
jgi:hypothetical protein